MRNGSILLIFHIYIYLPVLVDYPVQCWQILMWERFTFDVLAHSYATFLFMAYYFIKCLRPSFYSLVPRIPHRNTQVVFPIKVELCFSKTAYFAIILTEEKIWVPEMVSILPEITLQGHFSWLSDPTLCTFYSLKCYSSIRGKEQASEGHLGGSVG